MRTKLLNLKNDNNGTITLIPSSNKKAFNITIPQDNSTALTKENLTLATETNFGFINFGIINGALETANIKSAGFGLFYFGTSYTTSNCLLLTPNGVVSKKERPNITPRYGTMGANVGTNALFYAGNNGTNSNTCTLLNKNIEPVQSETTIGTARYDGAGVDINDSDSLNYSGSGTNNVGADVCTLLSQNATLIQSENTLSLPPYSSLIWMIAGARINNIAYIYRNSSLRQISGTCVLLQDDTGIGTSRYASSGVNAGSNALFYGGDTTTAVTIITASATLFQQETFIGLVQAWNSGSKIGSLVFYGGQGQGNRVTILSHFGVLLQQETTIDFSDYWCTGANVQ